MCLVYVVLVVLKSIVGSAPGGCHRHWRPLSAWCMLSHNTLVLYIRTTSKAIGKGRAPTVTIMERLDNKNNYCAKTVAKWCNPQRAIKNLQWYIIEEKCDVFCMLCYNYNCVESSLSWWFVYSEKDPIQFRNGWISNETTISIYSCTCIV